ncbi:hypothetical protein HK405_008726 [Cladochytrium tenue]|nr:hypothetical protein HK405_008726 [Cladochytrium tenue]
MTLLRATTAVAAIAAFAASLGTPSLAAPASRCASRASSSSAAAAVTTATSAVNYGASSSSAAAAVTTTSAVNYGASSSSTAAAGSTTTSAVNHGGGSSSSTAAAGSTSTTTSAVNYGGSTTTTTSAINYGGGSTSTTTTSIVYGSGSSTSATSTATSTSSLEVDLDYATVVGYTLSGAGHGNPMRAFLGVPYAQPPVGPLRFAAPQAITSDLGVLNTTAFKPNCMQNTVVAATGGAYTQHYNVSEDCLYLNIWIPEGYSSTPLPVMVWVYGGNFNGGAPTNKLYYGANLVDEAVYLDEPVIVVTFSYRLGAFGFSATEEIVAANNSNAGIKDQQAAFQWVKQNIAKFGGDDTRVTAFGQSAGADSIAVHLVAGATGLFDAVILESGGVDFGAVGNWSTVYSGFTYPLAVKVNCTTDVYECLMAVDATVLLEAQLSLGPTIRPYIDHTYIFENTALTLAAGEFSSVPMLLGNNKNEGTIFVSNMTVTTYDVALYAYFTAMTSAEIIDVYSLYPATDYEDTVYGIADAGFFAIADVIGDLYIQCPTQAVADSYSAYSTSVDSSDNLPIIYKYQFTHFPTWLAEASYSYYGVYHQLEVPYVFAITNVTGTTQDELDTISTMVGYWTHFAATFNPNGWSGQVGPEWPKYQHNSSLAVGGGFELQIAGGNASTLEIISDVTRTEKCPIWNAYQKAISAV